MKQITMDFETYQKELAQKKKEGAECGKDIVAEIERLAADWYKHNVAGVETSVRQLLRYINELNEVGDDKR